MFEADSVGLPTLEWIVTDRVDVSLNFTPRAVAGITDWAMVAGGGCDRLGWYGCDSEGDG